MKTLRHLRLRVSARTFAVAAMAFATSAALAAAGNMGLINSKAIKPGSVVVLNALLPAPIATPTVSVTTPVADVLDFSGIELPKVADKLDVKSLLKPAWDTGAVAPSGKPDVVGAFRFVCNASHLAYDDPIVYPGKPGAAHLHQFFGNTGANASSTYESLRSSGDSTCTSILNRSSYWMPAMMDGKGGVVIPDFMSVYYKRLPPNDPECQRMGKACVAIPRGLRFVFGHDMTKVNEAPDFTLWFNCDGPTGKSGHFKDIVEAAVGCPAGNRLGATINAPECWNGKDLDSPDHRSHMAYATFGDWGYLRCPKTHPYVIPTFTLSSWYTVDANLDRSGTWTEKTSTWYLSSDRMPGMPASRPGSTFHSDWFGAWDDDILDMWHKNCIDKLLNCTAGDLGNGLMMKESRPLTYNSNPRVVPVPRG